MKVRHLYVGEEKGLVKAFCGWRVATRNTTADPRQVTCQLCLGRRDGIAKKVLTEKSEQRAETAHVGP